MSAADPRAPGPGGGEALPVRPAARVLLVDPADRVLLFRSRPPADGPAFWFPVGGQIEPGESAEAALVREAREETGLAELSLGPEVFHRRFIFHWRGQVWDARERWWFARVLTFDPVFAGMEAVEIDDFSDCRWLSPADLHAVVAAGDRLTPAELTDHLPAFLAGDFTGTPFTVAD
ncbi:NUDIX hydrolase [Conexibacter sp. DBS9H8]|uniref:NUDIX hydrolase n=1 Tax=Conexibacter sp. DBS9H8 TaxID=2937801 RepID=UPI00200D6F09|nr:NUDIX domain-containing protein [Conexibacter sp. DBS9H8]